MDRKVLFPFIILSILCFGATFGAGYVTHGFLDQAEAPFPILNQALTILTDHGFKEIPASPILEYGMIRGMLAAYDDPHTIFVEPVQHELNTNDLQGSFGGIGARYVRESNEKVLLYPFPEGPAARAGILDGDQLISVDQNTLELDTSLDDILAAIRGPVGERVTLEILRLPDAQILEFKIRRESVPLPSVTWHLTPTDERVGIVEINILAASTPDEVVKAFEDLKSQGATHYVLDLRDNSGGLLTAGIDTARLFLVDGPVMQQQYRGKAVETFETENPGPLSNLPLVVLINQNTASAAEIIAGAVKQQGRASLIGTNSYGKDTVQLVFDLQDGSSLHVTSARWWIPELSPPIEENGLQPDVFIQDNSSEIDPYIPLAIEILLSEIP